MKHALKVGAALGLGGAAALLSGGAMAQDAVRERLRGHGAVVYLRVSPEKALARVGDADERPLLAGLSADERLARLTGLLEEREPAYASADLAVDTDGRSAGEVAARIARLLGDAAPGSPR